MTTNGIGRRRTLAGAAGIGLGLPVLAACGGDEEAATDPGGSDTPTDAGEETGGSAGQSLGATSEVPVGGGTIYADQKVVVTQPAAGDFRAFTAVCTHQGCLVGKVEGEEIQCPCHGSVFSSSDGSVVTGPATAPLEEVAISVDGDEITLA